MTTAAEKWPLFTTSPPHFIGVNGDDKDSYLKFYCEKCMALDQKNLMRKLAREWSMVKFASVSLAQNSIMGIPTAGQSLTKGSNVVIPA